MSSKTLEDEKSQGEEAQTEDNHSKQGKETAEAEAEVEEEDNSEKKDVNDKDEEENDHVEEKREEDAEDEGEEEDDEEEETKESPKVKLNKSRKESDPATPASERPSRERKTVERYTVSSPSKFPRWSSTQTWSIEKGNGTQLKDIPNVAFKLSKRKPDDNLRTLHSILFGKKAKAHYIKRNIGLFSGYVWAENEEKQRAKIRERIDKCVKEKLVDFCDVLNIPINKTVMKKEELSAKLFEFLESPHATTDVLLADKIKKGKKQARKKTLNKSSGEGSETPAKKHKQTSQVGKKRKQSSDTEEDDTAEPSGAEDDSQEDDVSSPKNDSDHEESKLEKVEHEQKAHELTARISVTPPVKKTTDVKIAKSNEKNPKRSTSEKAVTDNTSKSKQSVSKKQKTVRKNQDSKGKVSNKKQTDKSSKASTKDQGKGKNSEKAKTEPSREEMHQVAVNILKEVDFNTATLSDILRQLGNHFGFDLMHRKTEVKDIITDVINNMSDDGGEEVENGDDDTAL
ncbi:hypothetical protein VNO77_00609 [Canavalia gladiata]|uniref:DEK-C domain-containing protein n=1 Tax=Canavalia gladiata TaxID=3824 RepID=A0AAN9R4I8_CANGL